MKHTPMSDAERRRMWTVAKMLKASRELMDGADMLASEDEDAKLLIQHCARELAEVRGLLEGRYTPASK